VAAPQPVGSRGRPGLHDPPGSHDLDEAAAVATAAAHRVTMAWHGHPLIDSVPMHDGVRRAIIESADALGLSRMGLPSRAGHDSQNMALLGPTGMIFVPSRGGRSHAADEYTSFDAIAAGADVLLASLLELARGDRP
jgi:beta-ureidopropionase / N-carbamoyl-L-amino-acid hydrolase